MWLFLGILIFAIFNKSVYASEKVLINEVLIDPSQSIELINTDSSEINISGWYLDDSGGSTFYTIPNNSILYGNSCLVFSSDFNLNKASADTVRLFDNSGEPTSQNSRLIDSYSYKTSPGQNISFLRIPDKNDNWATAEASIGLFNESKSNCIITPTPTAVQPIQAPISESPVSPTPPISYNNIYINEAMVYPESNQTEWVELYNDNDFKVILNNWFIDDVENSGSTPKSFSIEIDSRNYGVIELTTSIFNNDRDEVRLLDAEKHFKNGFEYQNPRQSKTLGKISFGSDSFCNQEPTKSQQNSACLEPTGIQTLTSYPTSSPTPTVTLQSVTINDFKSSSPASVIFIDSGVDQPESKDTAISTNEGKVLGTSTKAPNKNRALATSFVFLTIVFSLLTIVSVFFKMMKRQKNERFN